MHYCNLPGHEHQLPFQNNGGLLQYDIMSRGKSGPYPVAGQRPGRDHEFFAAANWLWQNTPMPVFADVTRPVHMLLF